MLVMVLELRAMLVLVLELMAVLVLVLELRAVLVLVLEMRCWCWCWSLGRWWCTVRPTMSHTCSMPTNCDHEHVGAL